MAGLGFMVSALAPVASRAEGGVLVQNQRGKSLKRVARMGSERLAVYWVALCSSSSVF